MSPTEAKLTQQPLLQIRNLSKHYGSFQALSDISFEMKEGEIISVLGPSGCGKSTLLQLVAGLTRPDEGEIVLRGQKIASGQTSVPPEKRGVNMVFQDYALWPHMNVEDNIAYGLFRMNKAEQRARVTELLRLMQLEGMEKRLPPQLSGGQQQRVAIARALATRPQLMLLDEPLSNLDMRLRIEMRAEMGYLFRKLGISVFHVTHDPEEAFSLADRLLILRKGAIDQIGTPEQCFRRPASRWAASLLGAINHLPGSIMRTPRGTAIRTEAGIVEGVSGADVSVLPDGATAELLFRPDDLRLNMDNSSAMTLDKQQNALLFNAVHCTFEGNRWRTVLETTDSKQRLYLLSDQPVPAGKLISAQLEAASAYIYAVAAE